MFSQRYREIKVEGRKISAQLDIALQEAYPGYLSCFQSHYDKAHMTVFPKERNISTEQYKISAYDWDINVMVRADESFSVSELSDFVIEFLKDL